jgi:DUF1680 family protein
MCNHGQRKITRRSLLEQSMSITAGMALSSLTSPLFAYVMPTKRSQWKSDSYGTSRRAAQLVTLDAVKLQDGPFLTAMANDQAYMLSLDPDRFLYYFRTTAGLKPKAMAYGGWEEKVGRMLGHYLSACSMYARATSEPLFLQRQNYIVGELAECQRANGDGYVGGVTDARRIFTEIGHGNIYINKTGLNGIHAPWYMLHKMIAGLRDAYIYGQNDQALVVLTGFSDWAYKLTDPLSPAEMQKMLEDEHGGVNEIFADMYAITGKEKYLTLSRRFNRTSVLEPLTRGVDDLDGLHANTQIPTVLGLYRQYEVTGDAGARRGGEFFWQTVTQDRSYVIGGNSDKEHFYPKGTMGENLSVATAETCNSYNMVKLTDRLFAGTPREELAAYSERVLWNDILASLDKTTPGMTYYMSLKPGHFKTFSKPYESFWCCVGTGMENHAKYAESIYFHSADELWINQFIASEISWQAKKMRIAQNTRFPDEHSSQWKISCERPVKATLYLRHPSWTGNAFNVKVNGKSSDRSEPGTYVKMHRTWHDGDVITAQLPMRLHVETMHDDPSLKTVLYGPIVLAGLLGRESMPDAAPYADGNQLQFKAVSDPLVPTLAITGEDLSKCFEQTAPLEFIGKTSGSDRKIRFVPLTAVTRDRYSVYWKTT